MTLVVLTDSAKQDQLEIWLYIAADNPDAADRLLDEMDETLRLLSSAPGLGRARDDIAPGLRYFPIGNYLILYEALPDGITVGRIVQACRDIRMEPRIIKTDQQCRQARAEVERLVRLDPELNSSEGLRLELFSKLVEDYEKARFVFAMPDPVDAILFRMEQQGLRQKDIATLLGGKNRASEVLARKRRLTKEMIAALSQELDIPLELLVREPKATYVARRVSPRTSVRARRRQGG